MEKKNLKKWVIEKETISNLSKFQQGMVWGGYATSIWDAMCGYCSMENTRCDNLNCATLDMGDYNCNDSTIIIC